MAFENLISGLQAIQTEVTKVAATTEASAERMGKAAATIRDAYQAIGSVAASLPRAADAVDDLQQRIAHLNGEFAEELKLNLDLLEVGGLRLDEFLVKFGDFTVETEAGVKKISELLNGMDLRGRQQELQELIAELQRGGASVGDALAFLNREGGKFAETITGWVEAFKDGEITLDRLQQLLGSISSQFKGSDLEQLADALAEALRDGDL